jgi:hypothetical protein
MIKTKESARCALGALTVEMTKSPIAASAQEAMHPADGRQRRLMLIHEDPFTVTLAVGAGAGFQKQKPMFPTLCPYLKHSALLERSEENNLVTMFAQTARMSQLVFEIDHTLRYDLD